MAGMASATGAVTTAEAMAKERIVRFMIGSSYVRRGESSGSRYGDAIGIRTGCAAGITQPLRGTKAIRTSRQLRARSRSRELPRLFPGAHETGAVPPPPRAMARKGSAVRVRYRASLQQWRLRHRRPLTLRGREMARTTRAR